MNPGESKRTLEQIERELEEDQEAYDKKWYADNTDRPWDEFLKWADPEIKLMSKLSREKRMMMPYTLSEIPDFADVMSLEDFVECVKAGGFIDYDGSGNYCIDGKETNITIHPSDVKAEAIRWEFDTITWYNR